MESRNVKLILAAAFALSIGLLARSASAADEGAAEFAKKAAMDNMTEVQLAQLAVERSARADVKKFAQRLIKDHTTANEELARIADKKGIPLPKELDKSHKALHKQLSSLQGKEFDKQYLQDLVRDHTVAVQLFENEAKNGKDSDLKQWANKILPTLKEHLKIAQQLSAVKK